MPPTDTGCPAIARKKLTFYGVDQDDDSLVRAVIAGRKTVTADTVPDYYRGYGELGDGGYAPGDLIEVFDLRGRARCLIRATRVEIIRFGQVPERVWRGEDFDSAAAFQECHRQALAQLALHDDVELVALHFALVDVVEPRSY